MNKIVVVSQTDSSWQNLMVAMFPAVILQDDDTELVERLFD